MMTGDCAGETNAPVSELAPHCIERADRGMLRRVRETPA
jgi:hypothetical protein